MGIVHVQSLDKVAGRLQHHLTNWKLLTNDQWVWYTVKGYHVNLVTEPFPPTFNRSGIADPTGSKRINKHFRTSGTPHAVLYEPVYSTKK